MKKATFLFCVTLFVATASLIYAGGMMGWMMGGGASPMQHHVMHAENLKILKSGQVAQAMIHMSESLAVTCNFCHKANAKADAESVKKDQRIAGDFALEFSETIRDEALKKSLGHKKRAREMLKMVNYDNKNFLGWSHSSGRKADQVNCWVCHRGKHDKMVYDRKKEHKDFIDLF